MTPHRPRATLGAFALATACAAGSIGWVGCTTRQARYALLDKSYTAKPADYNVEVFTGPPPARAFVRIARLDVHIERTYFVGTGLNEAMPELREQARRAGADAIIDIVEKHSWLGEARIYHVTAIAIRY